MAVMNSTKLAAQIRSIRTNAVKMREQIHEALISCAYYAVKDGNTNPFNQLLDAVGSTARLKGITMWSEVYGFVRVKDEKFVLNKSARKEADVTDEASFASFEAEMRSGPKWWEIVGKEAVTSIFDPSKYIEGVIAKLDKEGYKDFAEGVKGLLADAKKNEALIHLATEMEKKVGEALH
jgi:hypothetical protein